MVIPNATEGHQHLIFLSTINIFLSIVAFLSNIKIIVALRKETSFICYRCLATTDLYVGLVSQLLAVTVWMPILVHGMLDSRGVHQYVDTASFVTSILLCAVSALLTLITVNFK